MSTNSNRKPSNSSSATFSARLRPIAGALLVASLASPALALDYSVSLGYVVDHTSNTGRTADNEVDENIQRPQADIQITHDGPRWLVQGDYGYERRIFSEDFFEDDDIITGSGTVVFSPIPERIELKFNNTRTESTIQAFEASTPGNRQVVDQTTAGPLIRLPVNDADELQLEYEYGIFESDTTDTGGIRHAASTRYVLGLSPRRSVTFALEGVQDQFENPNAPDVETITGTIGYFSDGDRLQLDAEVGYDQISRTLGREDSDGVVGNITASYTLSETQTIEAAFISDYSDRTLVLGAGRARFNDEVNADTDINELFRENNFRVAYSQDFGRTNARAELSYRELAFEDDTVPRDQEATSLLLTAGHQLTPRTTLEGAASFTERKFLDQAAGRTDDETRFNLDLRWQAGRNIDVTAGIRFTERDSNIDDFKFDELRYSVGIFYNFIGTN